MHRCDALEIFAPVHLDFDHRRVLESGGGGVHLLGRVDAHRTHRARALRRRTEAR